ncbi:MAG: NAD-dependent succinate-semialdehyde dehydrogenase, partial [Burkholderiales bacterium]
MIKWQELLTNPKLINTGLLINGNWIYDREQLAVVNPADGHIIATVAKVTAEDVDLAITTAYEAFLNWKLTNCKEKSRLLRQWQELMLANVNDLAKIITLESGKPLQEAQGEVIYAASYLEWFAEETKRLEGKIIPPNKLTQRILVSREPIGVCAAITPWNFPSAMLTRKVAPAIAAGCAIIARPSSQTPLSALALGYLALDAGLPAGLFNVIVGESELISNKLNACDKVRKLSFTGSTAVGVKLYQESAPTLKRLSLELGGNAPFIVFDDANLDQAVDGLIKNKFRNAGQTCVCANRIFVANVVHEAFSHKLVAQMQSLKVGNGLDTDTDIGPLINKQAVEHAQALIADAIGKGAQLLLGGESSKVGGNFFTPSILINCTPEMRIFNEEIFAPIVAIYRFNTDEEVIQLANATPYGLASYCYTLNTQRLFKVTESLEYG